MQKLFQSFPDLKEACWM